MIGLLLRVLLGSTAIALAIKYGAPHLAIAPTTANALIFVLLPTILVAGVLGWQTVQKPN